MTYGMILYDNLPRFIVFFVNQQPFLGPTLQSLHALSPRLSSSTEGFQAAVFCGHWGDSLTNFHKENVWDLEIRNWFECG